MAKDGFVIIKDSDFDDIDTAVTRLKELDEDPTIDRIIIGVHSLGAAISKTIIFYEAVKNCKTPVEARSLINDSPHIDQEPAYGTPPWYKPEIINWLEMKAAFNQFIANQRKNSMYVRYYNSGQSNND
jgi:hypothetical protein